eukprot:scaffold25353_cov22-Cyclotella_meneghiniana.AAC.2
MRYDRLFAKNENRQFLVFFFLPIVLLVNSVALFHLEFISLVPRLNRGTLEIRSGIKCFRRVRLKPGSLRFKAMCPRMKCAEYFLCRANWEMLFATFEAL